MKLLTGEEVATHLERLQVIEDYQKVLMFPDFDLDNYTEGYNLYQASQRYSGSRQSKAPTSHKSMEGVNIPSPLPSLNGNQVCTLYQFLQYNGGYQMIPTKEDGDCLFGAFRRGTDLPAEVADVHVRRLVIKVMLNYHEFFFGFLQQAIAMVYGCVRDSEEVLLNRIATGDITADELRDQKLPEPFSFFGYLKFMLQNSSYGDDLIITIMSQIWQMRITVLDAENLFERRF